MSNDPVPFNNIYNFNRYAYANNAPYLYNDPDGSNPVAVGRLSYAAARVTITPAINYGIRRFTAGRFVSLGDAIYGALHESNDGDDGDWTNAEYDSETDSWHSPLADKKKDSEGDNGDGNDPKKKKSTLKNKTQKTEYSEKKKGHTKKTPSKRNKHEKECLIDGNKYFI